MERSRARASTTAIRHELGLSPHIAQPRSRIPAFGGDRVLFGKYTSAHADDPAYQKTRDPLETAKRGMLEEIYKLTGLALPADKKIHVAFNDNLTDAPDPQALKV